ncbi:carbohydrate ABC transporter permease [Bombiscardovia coagulans]|uniref:Sugar ABC transporter, permease protein n=1 Tax=Bombiscardovia coagulans TaxID=686666 RepID=A0A261ETQ9_9BIFI|nr:sugar ABC transporter permease [Bombiscardovia coagulans]OZG50243.1 Sugar ABC transporter, permease protein [Bombiscardovia coagulans]
MSVRKQSSANSPDKDSATNSHNQSTSVRHNRITGSLMMLPGLALLAVFSFIPLARVVVMSMQGTDLFGSPSGFIGLENYITVFTDPSFISVLVRTIIYAVVVVLGRLILGTLLAIFLTRQFKGNKVFRIAMTSTVSVSVAAASLGFLAIFSPTGIINSALEKFNISPVGWLTDPRWAFPTITVVTIWTGLGFTLILLCAAIDAVDPEILEAARMDGATEARIQRSMILPLISPTLFYIAVTACIETLQAFAQINVMTKGGPGQATTTITYNIYTAAFGAGSANFGIASALGIVLFAFVFILTLLQFKLMDRKVSY